MKSNDWRNFFDGHAPIYMQNVFTKNTKSEVAFLLKILKLPKGAKILDIGCGTGRHSIELAKRGYRITGIDQSTGMLAEAEEAAEKAKVKMKLIQADATDFMLSTRFDAAICLCEGAFGLLGKDDDPVWRDIKILANIRKSLNSDARLVLTALNACRHIRAFSDKDVASGKYNPLTLTETNRMDCDTPNGKKSVITRERGFVATELRLMFELAGFEVESIWGGTAGDWGKRSIKLDEFEIMVIGRAMKSKSRGKIRRY
jgi:cyclopropane fatty-acyl-phospholipid synthase-like methyltransferase